MRLRFSTAIVLFFSGLLVGWGPALSDATQLDPWKTAKWIWDDRQAATANQEDSPRYFRHRLTVTDPNASATLWVTADNRCTTYVNGKKLGTHPSWNTVARYDIKKHLVAGDNTIAIEATNEGGPAGMLASLIIGDEVKLVSNGTWRVSDERKKGWNKTGFDDNQWDKAAELGASNMAPWNLTQKRVSSPAGSQNQAVDGAKLRLPKGFVAERLYTVPQEQGSWVAITTDPQGRLITSDQYGKLYRVTVGESPVQVEPIDLSIGHAQGLLHAFGSLYVMAHGNKQWPAGLYRLQDKDNDDQYEHLELLREMKGGGEHGPHAIVMGPDKKSLYICAGNHTQLPEVQDSRVTQVWQEDQATPRLPDARGHAVGRMAPGGWVCRIDPDGKNFELISSGYRNEYDIAFDPNGELFTYDADMEWDVGLPWYRPTRVCHVTSGSEYGWRHGSGKWPTWFPDNLPAVIDIGPGSPTGIVFGTGAKFPARYQNALYISDWSYGIIYAVHMKPEGASFQAEKELFCTAPALPVTDLVVNPVDGALYFLVGGRRIQSALYRVTYQGDESTAPAQYPPPTAQASVRKALEKGHGKQGAGLTVSQWSKLASPDRFVRYAARTALENLPATEWIGKLKSEENPQIILEAVMALARVGDPDQQGLAVEQLSKLDWSNLTKSQRLHLLRDYALILIRMGKPNPPTQAAIEKLASHFPANDPELDRELARLLSAANAPQAVSTTIDLLEKAPTQEEQIHYAIVLHNVQNGWTPELRERYFQWFLDAAGLQGGNSFAPYLNNIRQAAIKSMSQAEQDALADLLAKQPTPIDPYADLKARPFVKKWGVDDLLQGEPIDFARADIENGKQIFAAAQCFKCHRVQGQGGIVGPDLTNAGRRFNTRDLLETLIDPSKAVSDQYQATIFQMVDGRTVSGRVVNLNGKNYMVQEDMINPGRLTNINVDQIEDSKPSTVSMMPTGLLDNFTRQEIVDLLAYMKSTSQLETSTEQ
ncbi:MAG: c-type cytochrome [Mariniblastus sp.]|nr:c-type cytochrome [Mariniblastus sp.]